MTWRHIDTAPRDFTRVLVLTSYGVDDVNVQVASQSPQGGWLSNNGGMWLTGEYVPTHWQPLPLADANALSADAEVKHMLLEVLLGIGMIFHCTLEEMKEDPAIIITRIEQSLGPNGPHRGARK